MTREIVGRRKFIEMMSLLKTQRQDMFLQVESDVTGSRAAQPLLAAAAAAAATPGGAAVM